MTVPKFSELYSAILNDLRNRLGITTIIGKVVLNAIALVLAGKQKISYLTAAFIYKNVFPDQADSAELGGTLTRFGQVKLNRGPEPATAGVYSVQVTGTIGASIPSGTTFKSLDTSTSPDKIFILDTLFTFTGATGTISLRAVDLGPDAQLIVTDELQLTSPIANVDSYAEVIAVTTTPVTGETTDEYREKIIAAYRTETQGGAKTDYRIWAADAAGIREVYPYVDTPGIINLYCEANPDDSTPVDTGIPSASLLADVEDVVEFDPDATLPLNERGRRPMGAFQINFLAITPLDVDIDIVGLTDATLLTAIETAIIAHLFDIRPFIDGADDPNDSQMDLLYESDIYGVVRETIGSSATFTSLTVEVDGTPVSIYEFTDGDIPYLNSVTLS